MSETTILKDVMLEASKLGLVVFRNNTGVLMDKTGRPVKFGLCKGGADLIGFDRKEGFFVAIEVKSGNAKARPEQQIFLDVVSKSGGFSCLINDAKKLQKHLDEYKRIKYADNVQSNHRGQNDHQTNANNR